MWEELALQEKRRAKEVRPIAYGSESQQMLALPGIDGVMEKPGLSWAYFGFRDYMRLIG